MPLVAAINTAVRIDADPSSFGTELRAFRGNLVAATALLLKSSSKALGPNTTAAAGAWLEC
jgi:hypothetical protein